MSQSGFLQGKSLWTVGGTDPLGGAGVTSDLAVMRTLGVEGTAIVTAVTAQSPLKFTACEAVSPELLQAQWSEASRYMAPKVIKIGMIATAGNVRKTAELIAKGPEAFVIVDPVLKATATTDPVAQELVKAYQESLIPLADIVMPNADEAGLLTGQVVDSQETMTKAADLLLEMGAKSVLLKGGHLGSATDLFKRQEESFWLRSEYLDREFHGTGCALSSAVAAYLHQGFDLANSLVLAKGFLGASLQSAQSLKDEAATMEFSYRFESLPDLSAEPNGVVLASPLCSVDIGLYAIADSADQVAAYAEKGVKTIQLRNKSAEGDELLQEVKRSVEVCRNYTAHLYVNDDYKLAIACGAYGVHLGQEDLDEALAVGGVDEIKQAGLRFGISTHDHRELARANHLLPSYIALGPIFATTCKSMAFGPQGMEKITEWCRLSKAPVVAIGGLKCSMLAEVQALGASGMAVLSDMANY